MITKVADQKYKYATPRPELVKVGYDKICVNLPTNSRVILVKGIGTWDENQVFIINETDTITLNDPPVKVKKILINKIADIELR